MKTRSLLMGVAIGLFGALAVLTARYIAVVRWRAEGDESTMIVGLRCFSL
jgi:hypothetical protein